jgi:hypothetical protein
MCSSGNRHYYKQQGLLILISKSELSTPKNTFHPLKGPFGRPRHRWEDIKMDHKQGWKLWAGYMWLGI